MSEVRIEDAWIVAKKLRNCPFSSLCEKCHDADICNSSKYVDFYYIADLLDEQEAQLAKKNATIAKQAQRLKKALARCAEVTRERDAKIDALNAVCGINIFLSNAWRNKQWADDTPILEALVSKASEAVARLHEICAENTEGVTK